MDIKQIKNIISLFQGSEIAKMEVSESEGGNAFTIKLEKNAPVVMTQAASTLVSAPVTAAKSAQTQEIGMTAAGESVLDYNLVGEIKSPMVGIFYQSSDPEGKPFVVKGSTVKKGDTLCIIEAMKLMNEIVAERDGEIVEVCAKSGTLVEFGQVLFKIF